MAILKTSPLGFQWPASDPFLFCVHHNDDYPSGNIQLGVNPENLKGRNLGQDFDQKNSWRMYHGNPIPGFPQHPHRGFETVTIVRKGVVDHSDSMGAAGRFGHGDVQWMTAGKGIQHSEMFPLINQNKGNPLELFQIWLNLPSKSKMVNPYFKMLWSEEIPTLQFLDSNNRSTSVEVICGHLSLPDSDANTANDSVPPPPPPDSWAFESLNHVAIWNIKMEPEAEWILPKTVEGVNRTLYFYRGNKLLIGEEALDGYHMAMVNPEANLVLKSGNEECRILILQGRPIGEPVEQYGPFVMNTRLEIQETFEDYQKTGFGGWPWKSSDPLHGTEKRRFAKHSDGKIEEKPVKV